MRRSAGIVIAFTVSLVVSALLGPSPAAAHDNHMKKEAGHAHPALSYHPTPDHSQDDAKAGTCCMQACVPVIMNEHPPAQPRLRATGRVAPVLARITAVYRGEPPFHPPRRA